MGVKGVISSLECDGVGFRGEKENHLFFLMLFDSFNVIVLTKIINLNSPVIQTYNLLHESGHIGAVKYGLNTRMHDF